MQNIPRTEKKLPLTASKPNGGGRTSLPCVYGALRAFYSLQGKKTFVLLYKHFYGQTHLCFKRH